MKRSLKRLGLYLLAAMVLILLAEYFTIRFKIENLEEVEEKKDFARSAQISGQQIALLIQQHLNGIPNLTADIGSRIDALDHDLSVLRDGGRIDGTDVFVKPLSRLPKLSFEQLEKAWSKYRENALLLLTEQSSQPAVDSLGNPIVTNISKARAILPSQWLTLSNWYEKLETDLTEEAETKKEGVENWVLAFIFFDLVLLALLYGLFQKFVLDPIAQLEKDTSAQNQNTAPPPNEIGSLTTRVNDVLEQLKDAAEFVSSIGEGKLDIDYKSLDAEYAVGKNKLADSLIAMQEKLKIMSVEEQRRKWANEGLSKFVDILRSSNDNINTLGDKIISALVQYTESNQGGLYILNDDDEHNKYLELISLFAFDSKKFEKQKVKLGEGLLGQTFLEKETTLLNEVPEDYVRITSGLGDANPRALLFVPLKVDKNVYGIVELAAFGTFEKHEVEFIERLAETIASTLASVKAAQKNKHLIEQFQQQTEEMRAQEEEMRQNMEELQATQEEMSRKERDYVHRITELERQVQSGTETSAEYLKLKAETDHRIQQLLQQIRELETKLAQKPLRSDDWQTAEEVEKMLRFQLESMKATAELQK